MKRLIIAAAVLLFAACTAENPVLTVEGGQVRGVAAEAPGVIVYKGIPYAAPPVGDLRWKAPQPVVAWEGVRECSEWGAPSWQWSNSHGAYDQEFFATPDPEFSEDCLYLNVWTPAAGKPEAKLPVALWIHGGGYLAGWGFEPEMDGSEWAAHGGVLVTFNYRLGILGFLAHPLLSAENPDGISGNYGMLDQIAALKWVKNNIAAFGGDPDKITILGQSAGAMSVKTLVTSPLSKDLIAGAIIQSGGGLSSFRMSYQLADAEQVGKERMDQIGCTTLEQMRAIPAANFVDMQSFPDRSGSPVIDGIIYPETFDEATLAGRIADVPYMIGGTLDDMGGLADGIGQFCLEREKSGKPAYAYQFARRLPTDGRPGVIEGAFHSSDLWYMFKSLRKCWRPFTKGDYDLAEQMISFWTSFAATGNPGSEWTPCTAESPLFMVFRLDEDNNLASDMGEPLKP